MYLTKPLSVVAEFRDAGDEEMLRMLLISISCSLVKGTKNSRLTCRGVIF